MSLQEIKDSGMIEYYVLNLLTKEEASKIERYVALYQELQQEYLSIQLSLQTYAKLHSMVPRKYLENSIIEKVMENAELYLSQEVGNQDNIVKDMGQNESDPNSISMQTSFRGERVF